MIPKVIHYCWFGYGEKSALIRKCIKSWKKICPQYKIVEWNEDTFDISSAPEYVRLAYAERKWAYVADYVRLKVVYDHGGIYLDTDVELLKPLDDLLKYSAYFGFETSETINTGLGFGAVKGLPLLQEMMQQYVGRSFDYEKGQYLTCPLIDTAVFVKHGLQLDGSMQILDGNILMLPTDYLCPKSLLTEWIAKTENTVSIHHFSTSWFSEEQRKHHKKIVRQARWATRYAQLKSLPKRLVRLLLGGKYYEKLKAKTKGNR